MKANTFWTQQQEMRHISLPATIKNQHLFKKELDVAVKTRNIRTATIAIGTEQWVEPHDFGSENGTLHPEYNALDPSHWIPKTAVGPKPAPVVPAGSAFQSDSGQHPPSPRGAT